MVVVELFEELELFGAAGDDPSLSAGPCGERAVPLLGAGASVLSVGGIEDRLVCDPPGDVVLVPAFTVVDVVFQCGLQVLDGSGKQIDPSVALAHEDLTEQVSEGGDAAGADGIAKERVRSVERLDIAAAFGDAGPA